MSFWKSLFGGAANSGQPASGKPAQEAEHNGFKIAAEPYAATGGFQVAGTISKEINGELKTHKFVRADTMSSLEEAANFSIVKAKQIIDQQGDRLFG